MRMPPQEQIDVARMWLESNEGDANESAACKAVAAWIDHMAREAFLRQAAREGGITVATLRRRLAEREKVQP